MHEDTLANALGRLDTDPQVVAALKSSGVARRPRVQVDLHDVDGLVHQAQDWVSNLSNGIEFGFHLKDAFEGASRADLFPGPMLLTEVYFYGPRDGVQPYSGALPFGLVLGEPRDATRARLRARGMPCRSYTRDVWDTDKFRLVLDFDKEGLALQWVACVLPQPSPVSVRSAAGIVSAIALRSLLDRPWSDPLVGRTLSPEGTLAPLTGEGLTRWCDLRSVQGVRFGVNAAREASTGRQSQFVVRRIECFRGRGSDERRWPGELPFGLRWDDSPQRLFELAPEKPLKREEADFAGEATWTWGDAQVTFEFSTMENHFTRFVLAAA